MRIYRGRNLGKYGEKIMDIIYPPSLYCICCNNIIDDTRRYSLCDHCMEHIKWSGYEERCEEGLRIVWCADYSLYSRRIIFSLKYNGKKYIAGNVAEIMRDKLSLTEYDFDYIVPVPVSKEREKERGFNQMALAGKFLGKLTGKKCIADCLLRVKNTKPMRGLSPFERKENIKGTIALNEKYGKILKDRKILLIDDFFTTGSTALECYHVLMQGNPEEIMFLSFAAK